MEIRQILLRTDTAANWLSVDPVLGAGEIGTESDTGRVKVGDGTSAWSALGYGRVDLTISRDSTTVTVGASGDDAVLPSATTSEAGVMSAADKSKLDGITTFGDVDSGADNVLTGQNSFYNASGQVFGTDAQAEDGLILKGRAGGSEGYRVALVPAALDGNHEVQVPSRNGTLITSADSGTVTSAMIADGTIVDGDISGSAAIADGKLATISTAGKVANSATTATSANTASAIVARDGSGNFAAGTITAALSGNAATASAFNGTRTLSVTGDVTGSVASTFSGNVSLGLELAAGAIVNADINAAAAIADSKLATIASADKVSLSALNIDGATDIGAALADADLFVVDDGGVGTNRKAAATRITDYTFGKVSGDVTISSAGVAAIGATKVTNAMLAGAIADSKLSTISTAGKVANSATTATSANTASAIVARDASGNFTAGTITAALTGNASTATNLSSNRTFALTGDITGSVSSNLSSGASIATSIAAGVIVNADISATAEIAVSKLANGTARQLLQTASNGTDVEWATNIDVPGTLDVTGLATFDDSLDLAKSYRQAVVAVSALDIDCSQGNYFTKTINGDSTFTVSNVPASRAYAFTLELTHTSGAVTWFGGVEWPKGTAPTLTTGKTHLFVFVTDDGGTRWRGVAQVDYTN